MFPAGEFFLAKFFSLSLRVVSNAGKKRRGKRLKIKTIYSSKHRTLTTTARRPKIPPRDGGTQATKIWNPPRPPVYSSAHSLIRRPYVTRYVTTLSQLLQLVSPDDDDTSPLWSHCHGSAEVLVEVPGPGQQLVLLLVVLVQGAVPRQRVVVEAAPAPPAPATVLVWSTTCGRALHGDHRSGRRGLLMT